LTAHSVHAPPIASESTSSRWIERGLLVAAGLFLLVNTLALTLVRQQPFPDGWAHFGIWVLCAVLGSAFLNRTLPRRDPLLFPLAMFMSGWGLVLIHRLAPAFADRQMLWLAISTAALIAAAGLPGLLRLMRHYRYTILVFGLALLVFTILLGTNPSGQAGAPALWLGLGSLYFQPSEALKIILVAFLASYLAEQYPALRAEGHEIGARRLPLTPRIFGPILLMWGLSVVVLVWQRDLGTAVLFFFVFMMLLYVASGYRRLLIAGSLLIVIAALAAYNLFDVVRLRVDIWLYPWAEADGRAYQIVQSLMAFASGGVFGQGIGQGSATYIPVVHSDFIFAALAEEWGLLGVIATLAAIAAFVARGMRIAILQNGRPFHTLLTVGLATLYATQCLLIIGGVLKLIPLTGVTLPFFSYGGSSLLVNFVMVGLLLRLSAGEH